MHDQFRKRFKVTSASARLRQQIALEAARRLFDAIGPKDVEGTGRLEEVGEGEYYTAKRKAAAVLGHRVRPGDLPSDSEVRTQLLILSRSRSGQAFRSADLPEPGEDEKVEAMADHLDR